MARRLSATPPSWVGSALSNSVGYLAAERIKIINNMRAALVWVFFAYKKILGRTETRTRDRMYLGRIRSVRDISRGDGARIATCSLRTPTDLRHIVECRYSFVPIFSCTYRCWIAHTCHQCLVALQS